MTPRALPDAAARLEATTRFDANVVVEAGAGTGKTSILVERLLVAVGAGLVRVGEFAAITFTEKAAGEMRDRLAEGLERLRLGAGGRVEPDLAEAWGRALDHLLRERGVEATEVAARALAALADLDRATVATIHRFCADLLRAYPFDAGVDPGFDVDQGPIFQELLDEEWERFLAEELGPRAGRAELWRGLLERLPLGTIRKLAFGLSAFSVPESLLRPDARGDDAPSPFREEAAALAASVLSVLDRQKGMTPSGLEKLRLYHRALDTLAREGPAAFLDLAGRAENVATIEKGIPTASKPVGGVTPEELKSVAGAALSLVRELAKVDDGVFRLLVEAAAPFARRARARLLERGAVNFDGLLSLARDLLREHPDVRDDVRRRYRMLLVDEFQDTDPLQYEIVLYLAGRSGERGIDPFDLALEPGRLFIVGDPKQSIYRFRGADYAAFLRAVDRVLEQGGSKLDLVANFRSVDAVIEPVNGLFRAQWTERRPYQPPYVAIASAREDQAADPRVEIRTVRAVGAEARREAEGKEIARCVAEILREGKRKAGDVMLLLRAFTHLPFYLRPLREAGIPFIVDGGRQFLERTEVTHLMAALRALARPSDPAALLAFLRSPAGGVPDHELAVYAAGGGSWRYSTEPDPAAYPGISRAFGLLRELARETEDLPADVLVREVLARSGLLPLAGFAYEGAQRVANLRKLAAAAADLARDGTLSLNEVLDALESERAGAVEGDSPLAGEGHEAVRVLTVHKAKGLESRIVLVADLAREGRRGGLSPDEEVGIAALPGGGAALALKGAKLRNSARVWLEREEKRHEEAEDLRTFYVALTRARERLILFAAKPKAGAPWIEALAPWGYAPDAPPGDGERIADRMVLHVAARDAAPVKRGTDLPEGEPEAVAAWESAVRAVKDTARAPFRRPSGIREDKAARHDDAEGDAAAAAPARDVALAAGTAVHAALEQWDPRSGAPLAAGLPELAARAAAEHGADPAAVEREAREALDAFAASPLAERLRSVDVLGREVPVLLREEDGTTVAGFLDLLYRDADGTVVVADYKTDRALSADEAETRYGAQLGAYAETVRRAMRLTAPPRTELWLVRRGEILLVREEPG